VNKHISQKHVRTAHAFIYDMIKTLPVQQRDWLDVLPNMVDDWILLQWGDTSSMHHTAATSALQKSPINCYLGLSQ